MSSPISDKLELSDSLLASQLAGRIDSRRLIDQIIIKSEGVFLHAERVCHDIQHGYLSLDRIDQFPQGLGETFVQFFNRLVWVHESSRPDYERFKRELRPLLRVILAAAEPLPVQMLQRLFHWREDELNDAIGSLGALFPVATERSVEVIKPCHQSVSEWLISKNRSGPYYPKGANYLLSPLTVDGYPKQVRGLQIYVCNPEGWRRRSETVKSGEGP